MSKAKEIILHELEEQAHPENVGNVIFWALEHYAAAGPEGTLGRAIAFTIKERIQEAEIAEIDELGKKPERKICCNSDHS